MQISNFSDGPMIIGGENTTRIDEIKFKVKQDHSVINNFYDQREVTYNVKQQLAAPSTTDGKLENIHEDVYHSIYI